MPRKIQTREARAEAMVVRLPHVPKPVAAAMAAHFRQKDFTCRGVPAALEAFFGHLAGAGRSPLQARTEDFETVSTSRTRLYALLYGLKTFAPHVPLAAARPVQQRYDAKLNATYNAKEMRPRKGQRVALVPERWPTSWQGPLPLLDKRVRFGEAVFARLAPRTRNSVVQAVGMCARAREWAGGKGVAVSDAFDDELVDVTARYLLVERAVSPRTTADYFERIRMFALRGNLIDEAGYAALSDAIAELRDDANAVTPGKIAKVREFERKWHLGDILIRAHELSCEAEALPGHTASRARLALKAVVLGLLVNGCDRQGDLQKWRIGREIVRMPTGAWSPAFRQGKSGGLKENGALWAPVCAMVDAHVLGDRPSWLIEQRVAELDGMHMCSLGPDPFGAYLPSTFIREEFEIGAHLVRTLVTDLLRRHQPDAAWAAQLLLGHATRTMQQSYRTDFRDVAAVEKGQATILQIVGAAREGRRRMSTGPR
jgi:hypothetical protein